VIERVRDKVNKLLHNEDKTPVLTGIVYGNSPFHPGIRVANMLKNSGFNIRISKVDYDFVNKITSGFKIYSDEQGEGIYKDVISSNEYLVLKGIFEDPERTAFERRIDDCCEWDDDVKSRVVAYAKECAAKKMRYTIENRKYEHDYLLRIERDLSEDEIISRRMFARDLLTEEENIALLLSDVEELLDGRLPLTGEDIDHILYSLVVSKIKNDY